MNPNFRNVLDPAVRRDLERGRYDIVFFAWRFLGLTLHPGQIRIQRLADGIVNVIVCGNRFGKTAGIIAVRHIWYNFYKKGMTEGTDASWQRTDYRTAALGPFSDVCEVDYRIIYQIMTSSFQINVEGEPVRTNKCAIEWFLDKDRCRNSHPFFIAFKDNCGIRFFSGQDDKFGVVQGKKFGYGSYDEGGRSHHLAYELKSNLIPRFGEMNAPLDLISTPDQKSPSLTYHYEIFQKGLTGAEGFKSFEGSAYENIYLPKHYFERIKLALADDPLIDQVLYGKFVFGGETFYDADQIQAARDKDLNGGVKFERGHRYTIATDTAVGSDEQAYTVLDVPEGFNIKDPDPDAPLRLVRQVAFVGSSKSPAVAMADFEDLWDHYDKEKTVRGILETFNEGSIRWYHDLPDHIRRKTRCYGSYIPPNQKLAARLNNNPTTNGGKKVDMLIALRKCLSAGVLRIPDDNKELIQQLNMYREDDEKLKTDRIISLALACWMVLEGQQAHPKARAVAINW